MGGGTVAVDRGVLFLFLATALVGFASASPSLFGPCGGPLRVGFLSSGINIERARGMPRHWSLGSLDLWLWLMEWVVLPCMNLFVLVMIISSGKLFALSAIQLQFKTVFENTLMQHHVGLPPGSMGKISYIATAGRYSLQICRIQCWNWDFRASKSNLLCSTHDLCGHQGLFHQSLLLIRLF